MKIPFFFRTRNEFDTIRERVTELNKQISRQVGHDQGSWVYLTCKYQNDEIFWKSMPRQKRTKKRYEAMLKTNKEKMERLGIDIEEFARSLNVEFPTKDVTPKYLGERTEVEIVLQTHDEHRALVSIFDKAYGRGNWKIIGPRGMQQVLKRLQDIESWSQPIYYPSWMDRYKNGVPVKIVINEPDANVKKYLFKMKLKA